MWHAAHVIMYFKFKDRNQDSFLVWENVFLINAPTSKEAHEKAKQLGLADEGDSDGSLTCGGRPATLTFAGVRKVVEIRGPREGRTDEPADGAEATYSVLEVKDAKALARLAGGKPVAVRYQE